MLTLYLNSVIFILSLAIMWQRRYKRNLEPPYLPGYMPIIGHAYKLIGSSEYMYELIQELSEKTIECGDTARFALGPQSHYVLSDPDDAMTVATYCMNKNFIYSFALPWLGDGLISCPDDVKWRQHRKLLNHAFNQQVLDGFLPVFNNNARRLVDQFAIDGRTGPFYTDKLVMRNALETIYQTGTGLDLSEDKVANEKYITLTDDMFQTILMRVQNIFYHYNFLWNLSGLKARQDAALKYLHGVGNKILEIRKEKLNRPPEEGKITGTAPKSFSDVFFNIHDNQAKGVFTEQDVIDQVNTLIVAGYDAVATTLVIVMLMIGSYPKVQEKVYAELQEVFDNTDRDVERQDLSRLIYMGAVIKEVLRLYPVGPMIIRHLDKDVRLKNYTLSAGKSCLLLINAINRHPKWWEDPKEFKPERWLSAEKFRNPFAFSTFSLGRRNCIGQTYAMMWIKTYLSHVLRKYHISSDIKKAVLKYEMLTKVSSEHYISLQSRT